MPIGDYREIALQPISYPEDHPSTPRISESSETEEINVTQMHNAIMFATACRTRLTLFSVTPPVMAPPNTKYLNLRTPLSTLKKHTLHQSTFVQSNLKIIFSSFIPHDQHSITPCRYCHQESNILLLWNHEKPSL